MMTLRRVQSECCIVAQGRLKSSPDLDTKAYNTIFQRQAPDPLATSFHDIKHLLPDLNMHEKPMGEILVSCLEEAMQHIEALQSTIKNLLSAKESLESQLTTKLEDSVTLRQNICSLHQEFQKTLFEKRAMIKEMDRLRSQVAESGPSMFETSRRSIIISKLLSRSSLTDQLSDTKDEALYPNLGVMESDSGNLLDTVLSTV
ncbi:unnamed protein product, partial [Fusarium langsethiae]